MCLHSVVGFIVVLNWWKLRPRAFTGAHCTGAHCYPLFSPVFSSSNYSEAKAHEGHVVQRPVTALLCLCCTVQSSAHPQRCFHFLADSHDVQEFIRKQQGHQIMNNNKYQSEKSRKSVNNKVD